MVDFGYCLRDPAHKRVKFSEQQLVSCDSGNSGCDGGLPHKALDHIDEEGLATAERYPYTSGDTEINGECSSEGPFHIMTFSRSQWSREPEERLLYEMQSTPVAVTIEAGNSVFQHYKSGIVPYCTAEKYNNHVVLAVAFDKDSIKIKNSWGSWWGDNGYMRLRRGSKGTGVCGILRYGLSMRFEECSIPAGGLDTWYYNKHEGEPIYGCSKPDGDQSKWVMLNAYREGGVENVHWRYVKNNDTEGCLHSWKYFAADGKTLIEHVPTFMTKTNKGEDWCALPVYRPGGEQGNMWDHCSC